MSEADIKYLDIMQAAGLLTERDIFSRQEVENFFELANAKKDEGKICSFHAWLESGVRKFLEAPPFPRPLSSKSKAELMKFLKEIEEHSLALIKLIGSADNISYGAINNSYDYIYDGANIDYTPYITENFEVTYEEWIKKFGEELDFSECRLMQAQHCELEEFVSQLMGLNIVARMQLKSLPPNTKGRKNKSHELKAFALGYAIRFTSDMQMEFTLDRYRDNTGEYITITPAHRIFSEIIAKISLFLEQRNRAVTDKNIINALEYAQKMLNGLTSKN
jgi:hypothetical protein